jgi:hypothetical protein
MSEFSRPRLSPPSFSRSRVAQLSFGGGLLLSAALLVSCSDEPGDDTGGAAGTTGGTAGVASTAGSAGLGGGGSSGSGGVSGAGAGAGGSLAGSSGAGTSGAGTGGSAGTPAAGASGAGTGGGGLGGTASGGAGGTAGLAGSAGTGGMEDLPPAMLSETGLFTTRGSDGVLVLAEGVREFEPMYALWSDAAIKQRYVYLPAGTKIDTTDPDHWVFPLGAKLWKSFSVGTQLVETRLLERIGDEPNHFRYATYYWRTADALDAERMNYRDRRVDAAETTHDIPSGQMCERCHNALEDHALGFSALQLNHDRPGGVTLASLNDEGWLTTPVPLTIKFPGDAATQNVLGYLHANCGNCHNDSPGLPVENIPAPQMYLRVLIGDEQPEDTGTYRTAVNQLVTGTSENVIADYRIMGGSPEGSAAFLRMGTMFRLTEDQMPPIGSELEDTDGGRALLDAWIRTLPAPTLAP